MARPRGNGGVGPPRRCAELEQLEKAFAEIDIEDNRRANLCRRYLDYMDWLEAAAIRSRRTYYGLRLIAVVTAAIVPALVASYSSGTGKTVAIVLGVVVAATTATEAFLHAGDRWRHYRRVVEQLKAQAWLFAQQAGPYAGMTPAAALGPFVETMEALIHEEVQDYVSTVVADRAAAARATEQSGSEASGSVPARRGTDSASGG